MNYSSFIMFLMSQNQLIVNWPGMYASSSWVNLAVPLGVCPETVNVTQGELQLDSSSEHKISKIWFNK